MRIRVRPVQLCAVVLLVLIVAGSVAACGGQGSGTPPPPSSFAKPTGKGTPVPGAPISQVTHAGGHYEAIIVAQGVAYASTDTGGVYAFRTSDGAVLWRENTGSPATIYAVTDGAAYALSGPAYDTVYALRADTGAVLWQHAIGQNLMGMVVTNGMVYLNDDASGTVGSTVYALRASDGTPLWHYTAPGVAMSVPITVAAGIVYAYAFADRAGDTSGASLDALDASSGKLLWTYPFKDEFSAPAIVNGVVYATTYLGKLDAIQAATGKLVWQFTCDPDQNFPGRGAAPVVAGGTIYVAARSVIYALRLSDGTLLWRADTHSDFPPMQGQPVVGDGAVYYTAGLGDVSALRASDGATLWRQHINNSVMGMTEENGRVDVMTQLNVAYALRAGNGALLWQQSIGNFATWEPSALPYAVVNGVIYVGTDRGVVQAIRASDGVVLWQYSIPPNPVPTEPIYSAAVTFAPSVPHATALRTVTDLGLWPSEPCLNVRGPWQPVESGIPWNSWLLVASTSLAPVGWLARLQSAAGVTRVQPNPAFSCPAMGFATPVPGGVYFLPPEQAGTLVQITFSASTDYDTALALVYDQGFVLANPCYDELPQGTTVHWTAMGQETDFASTYALLVVTSALSSTQWQQQAQKLAGVTRVEIQPEGDCGGQ